MLIHAGRAEMMQSAIVYANAVTAASALAHVGGTHGLQDKRLLNGWALQDSMTRSMIRLGEKLHVSFWVCLVSVVSVVVHSQQSSVSVPGLRGSLPSMTMLLRCFFLRVWIFPANCRLSLLGNMVGQPTYIERRQ